MESLIRMMSKLDDILNTVGNSELISLPQIVAIGSQSSGKSSVLENIVGRDFIPRSNGVCTRRPLKLDLVKNSEEKIVNGLLYSEWAEFAHKPGQIFVDWKNVEREIVKETEKACGTNKGIVSKPIGLKVFSPNVVALTLVDLPGITRIPVGDQPADIEDQIINMILSYIQKPNTLILAVTPANTDFATSEAIKLARMVDPDGKRTLAVITKLDIMDRGTDAMDILTGRVFPIRLGIIGIVCRSQQDLNQGKTIRDALEYEKIFFRKKYPSLAAHCGSPYLRRKLSVLLVNHIKDCLPEISIKINVLRRQFQTQLQYYGYEVRDYQSTLLHLLTRFATEYENAIDGAGKVNLEELAGGARINYIFHDTFGRTLEKVDPLEGINQVEIMTAIRNSSGTHSAVFVPDLSFELLVRKQIARLEEPSLRCIELVQEELKRIIQDTLASPEFARFPKLQSKIREIVAEKIRDKMGPTRAFIGQFIKNELAYINCKHPDFTEARNMACKTMMKEEKEATKRECAVVEQLIKSYFLIVRKNIQDAVPKTIMNFIVNDVKDSLQGYLVKQIYKVRWNILTTVERCTI